MKKIVFILSILVLVASCKSGISYSGAHGEKTQKDAEAEFLSSLTESDQDAVLNMAEDFMKKLKDGQVEEAVDMIYVLHNDVVYKKSAEYTAQLVSRFKYMFPVLTYERRYYSFSTEGNNDISYSYTFGPERDGQAPSMKLMFNPVYVDGQRYLTFKDGSQSSKVLPVEKQINEMAPAPKDIRLNKKPE